MHYLAKQFNDLVYDRVAAGVLSGQTFNGQVVGQVIAGNGYVITLNINNGRLWDNQGRYGYNTHFGGLYVCYTCGHLCECAELEED